MPKEMIPVGFGARAVTRQAFAAMLLLAGVASAETVRLKATADIGVSSVVYKGGDERVKSWGLHSQFKLKSIQEMGVVRFDAAPAVGREVIAARLNLHRAGRDRLRYIRVSTVNGDWREGSTKKPYGPPSGACYNVADWETKRPWSWPGSQLCDVIMSSGNSLHHVAECEKRDDGWLSVPLAPELVYALCVGDTDGLALQDGGDLAYFNNFIHSVQSGRFAPYLEVDLGVELRAHPVRPAVTAARGDEVADVRTGAIRVRIAEDRAAFCWRVSLDGERVPRWQVPHPARSGPTTFYLEDLEPGRPYELEVVAVSRGGGESLPAVARTMASAALPVDHALDLVRRGAGPGDTIALGPGARVWACPGLVKIDPLSGRPMNSDVAAKGWGAANAVWDGRAVRLFGCRGEYVSFQLVIQRVAANGAAAASVRPEALRGSSGSAIGRSEIELYRTWLAKNRSGKWQPAYCVPLDAGASVRIPDPARALEGQRCQTIYVDVYIPKDASPGTHAGAIVVGLDDSASARVPVEVEVFDFEMPDRLAFWPQLNCYRHGVPRGVSEVDIYRLCHQHRCVFFRRDYTPKTTGSGKNIRVDWNSYDKTVGPLLSGEAFKNNRRAGVPIEALALPFYDSWPTALTPETYRYKGNWKRASERDRNKFKKLTEIINEHFMTAPPIEEGLTAQYKDAFVAVQRQFIEHMREKGWDRTEFQCLFMGKNTHRIRYNVNMWWTTDEPYHWDDWMALRFFARLWTANRGEANAGRWIFRADISRPQWQGRTLDGVVDAVHFGTGAFSSPANVRRCRTLARRAGFDLRVYGGANPDDRSNTESVAWILNAWLNGANAALPWQTMGNDTSLDVNDSSVGGNALVAPGKRFGVPAVADIRLKAFRDAEQIVEYLVAFARRHGLRREQVAAILARSLRLDAATAAGAGADNADALRFGALQAWQIASLRRALAEGIVAAGRR